MVVPMTVRSIFEIYSNTLQCNEYSNKSFNESHLKTSCNEASIVQRLNNKDEHLTIQPNFQSLNIVLGPFGQIQLVYNAREQTKLTTKDKGTSQIFKSKSQGIGTVSSSESSVTSTTRPRRAIEIQSCLSISVQLFKKGDGSISPSEASSIEEPDAKKGKNKVKQEKIKAKKGKSKDKALHRCLCTLSFPTGKKDKKPEPCKPGVCTPGECTPSECFKRIQGKNGDKKGKKQKSVDDISKASGDSRPTDSGNEKKKKKKTCCARLCDFLCCKKRKKNKELKHPVTGTDISVKNGKVTPYGSSTSTQAGKKKLKKGKGKKGDKGEKGDVTLAAGKKVTIKDGHILKEYECEPGVCSPKDCIPQECYDRKFPPPPPKKVGFWKRLFENCCKCCIKKKKDKPINDAATQSRKSKPGETSPVYKESGTKSDKKLSKKVKQDAPLVVSQPDSKKGGKKQKKGTPLVTNQPDSPADAGKTAAGRKTVQPSPKSTGTQAKVKQTAFDEPHMPQYYEYDSDFRSNQQGINIGSECSCSVEFYRMSY